MTASTSTHRILAAGTFLTAAKRYWLNVFPQVRRETRYWHQRAHEIPDPALRRLALDAQRAKQGNVEGSAAFAAFAPLPHRAAVIRAQVAFQSIYDYADTLAEQPSADALANARQLHQALTDAINPSAAQADYYRHYPYRSDGGYLAEMVDACRTALAELPSRRACAAATQRFSERIVSYQSLNLNEQQGGQRYLKQWALQTTPAGAGLRWWETAASAGSSLGLFALIAASAKPMPEPHEILLIEDAYWPWIGALHSLLDSVIDEPEDTAAEQHSLLHYYNSPEEAAARLQMLASESLQALRRLSAAHEHELILAAMASHYLSAPEASTPTGELASKSVLPTIGGVATASMLVLRARHTANRLHRRRSARP
jgi:tetraprenyl-beta-curcumene synthase